MAAVIANPICNSPFDEPTWHFHFDDDGIANEDPYPPAPFPSAEGQGEDGG
jgi:hypothetical protein